MTAILCCLLPLTCVGCGINGAGMVLIETIPAKGATVIRAKSYGLHLNTEADDAGASLGIAETLAVYPASRVPASGSTDGWFRIQSPWPNVEPAVVWRRVIGVALGFNHTNIGLSVGVSERTLLARVSSDQSMTRRLLFLPDSPELTELEICEGTSECFEQR